MYASMEAEMGEFEAQGVVDSFLGVLSDILRWPGNDDTLTPSCLKWKIKKANSNDRS